MHTHIHTDTCMTPRRYVSEICNSRHTHTLSLSLFETYSSMSLSLSL